MNLVNTNDIYKKAMAKDYAIGGFCGYNMEMIQAIIEAAEFEKSPVLVQASCRVIDYAGADMIKAITEIAAKKASVPIALNLDHGDTIERCIECVDSGFTSVMLDNTGLPFDEQVRRTKTVVDYAHPRGVSVEGEICHKVEGPELYRTSVEEAVKFVELTGCDSLSICVGNAHGQAPDHEKQFDFELLENIHKAIPEIPLVLHATSIFSKAFLDKANSYNAGIAYSKNFSEADLHATMPHGVSKINSCMDLKIATTTAIRQYMQENPREMDPRKYFAMTRTVLIEHIRYKIRNTFRSSAQA